jgi:hypothetical protein
MDSIVAFLLVRLNEPSTWRGLIWLITALGLALSPEQKESIVTTGMALAGLVGVFTKDKSKPTPEQIQKVEETIQQKVDEAVLKSGEIQNENPSSNNFFNDK